MKSLHCCQTQVKNLGNSHNPENMAENEKLDYEGGMAKYAEIVGKAAGLAAEMIMKIPKIICYISKAGKYISIIIAHKLHLISLRSNIAWRFANRRLTLLASVDINGISHEYAAME